MNDCQSEYITDEKECDENKEYKEIKISLAYNQFSKVEQKTTEITVKKFMSSDEYQQKRKCIIYYNNLTKAEKESFSKEFFSLMQKYEGKNELTQEELFLMVEESEKNNLLIIINEWLENILKMRML